jgi:hypothetical protein
LDFRERCDEAFQSHPRAIVDSIRPLPTIRLLSPGIVSIDGRQGRLPLTKAAEARGRVARAPDRDSVEPRRESGVAAEQRQSPPSANEAILRRLLGLLRGLHDTQAEGIDRIAMAFDKNAEGLGIPAPRPFDEQMVGSAVSLGLRYRRESAALRARSRGRVRPGINFSAARKPRE